MHMSRRKSFIALPVAILALVVPSVLQAISPFFVPKFLIKLFLQNQTPFVTNWMIFEFSFSNPDVNLAKKDQRIFLSFDIRISVPNTIAQNGKVAISSSFIYEANSHTIFLKDPILTSINFDQVDERGHQLIKQLSPFMKELLNGYPIYKLRPEDLKLFPKAPSSILVEDDGIRFYFS
jgi:hypothetical protein